MDRFNAAVTRYFIMDHNDDRIFEPGTEVFISRVNLMNNGGLTLPGGAVLQFPSTPSAISANITEVLPPLGVRAGMESKTTYRLLIPDAPGPVKNGNYAATSVVTSHITTLGRVYPESLIRHELPVQYPIRVSNITATTWLGPNEVATLVFAVDNISSKPYGTHHAEMGTAAFQLRVDPLFTVLPPADGSYSVSADGVAVRAIESLAPGARFTISVHILMKGEAGLRLYETVPWQAELYLRDRCIEFWTRGIRVTPVFVPNGIADVVLVTCDHVDRREFLAWSYLVQLLGLSVNFWDVERYHGMSTEDFTWVGQTRVLVYLTVPEKADLSLLRFADFLAHFAADKDNAILFMGCLASNLDALLYDYRTSVQGVIAREGKMGEAAPVPWKGIHYEAPNAAAALVSADDIRKSREQQDKRHLYSASADVKIAPAGCLQFEYGIYGLYKATLPRTAKLITLPTNMAAGKHTPLLSAEGMWLPFDFDGKTFKARDETYPSNAPFTRALLSLFDLLPLERRVTLMCDYPYLRSLRFSFSSTANGLPVSNVQPFCDVAMASFAQDIEHEFWTMPVEFESAQRLIKQMRASEGVHAPAAPYVIGALQNTLNKTFWKAFPWCCGDVSARRTQLTGYVTAAGGCVRNMSGIKVDPAVESKDAAGEERKQVLRLTSGDEALALAKTKLATIKSRGAVFTMKEMTKAQYPAATARSSVVIPEQKIEIIRRWQIQTFELNAQQKRIREEKKAWMERKMMEMAAPPPPPTYFQSLDADLSVPAATGYSHPEAKYAQQPGGVGVVAQFQPQSPSAFVVPDVADKQPEAPPMSPVAADEEKSAPLPPGAATDE